MSGLRRCLSCGKEEDRMNCCGKCKIAFYCSRECQKRDWKQHKKTCKTPAGESETASGGKSGGASSSEMKWWTIDFATGEITKSDVNPLINPEDFPKVELLPMELQLMVDKVKSSLPWDSNFFGVPTFNMEYTFVTDFGKIKSESESDWDPALTPMTVLLAKMVEFNTYQYRHGIFISDVNYKRHVVFFHNEAPPSPYFKWNQVTPGNFICIRAPKLHYFKDGHIGFRVDNPGTVRILCSKGICLSGR